MWSALPASDVHSLLFLASSAFDHGGLVLFFVKLQLAELFQDKMHGTFEVR